MQKEGIALDGCSRYEEQLVGVGSYTGHAVDPEDLNVAWLLLMAHTAAWKDFSRISFPSAQYQPSLESKTVNVCIPNIKKGMYYQRPIWTRTDLYLVYSSYKRTRQRQN